jgi:catechol 2,3-dioxygenase-like lactoylglutathione lyase family enzyme
LPDQEAFLLDHISLGVPDPQASKAFFDAALKPLGIVVVDEFANPSSNYLGYAYGYKPGGFAFSDARALQSGRPYFWVGGPRAGARPMHIAFSAQSVEEVDAFYAAAIAAGGKDHGAPGERAHYHPGYYGAFVLDHDGNNIEAVCRTIRHKASM